MPGDEAYCRATLQIRRKMTSKRLLDNWYQFESSDKKHPLSDRFTTLRNLPGLYKNAKCFWRLREMNPLGQCGNKGKRVVILGAGARGVALLNILKDPRIEYAVDINPLKQDKYVPGTEQKIVE
jgi:hypothetical protein